MAANLRSMHTRSGAPSDAGEARGRRRTPRGLFILLLALMGDTAVVWAQARPVQMAAVAAAAPAEAAAAGTEAGGIRSVQLLVGHSTVIETGEAISRVSLTSADVADAMVTAPQQLLVHGKTPGTISMFVWARGGGIQRYEVSVQRDLAGLNDQVRQLFPGEKITAASNGRALVLSGHVSNKDVATKAIDVAAGYVDKKDDVVNLLQVGDVAVGNQVLLRVRFAEVSRNALTDLGASFLANGYHDKFGRITTQQFAAPDFDSSKPGGLVFSDFLNLFFFDAKNQLGAVVKALQTKGLFQTLAEPNLVAESGKEASFLAGGEFPIPVVQGSGSNMAISIIFKEFGVRLSFTPTVNGNRVQLKVKPEVSTLDFNNAVQLQGFRIPALSTRRTETELELENGQTFAIAGLMNNSVTSTMMKIPGIGDIPILGQLFRSKQAQKDHTELVVMITPEILSRTSPGVTDQLPRVPETFLAPLPDKKTVEPPPPAFRAPKASASTSAPAPVPAKPRSDAVASPASAAAAVAALSPKRPTTIKAAELNAQPASAAAPSTASASASAAPAASSADAKTAAAMEVAPANAAPAARPLNADEKKLLEKMQKEQDKKEQAAKAAEAKRQAKEAEEQARTEKKAQELKAKADKEQAKRDAEAAKKQAEADRERQQKLDEAAAKVKAAQAAYDAELARPTKGQ